VFQEELPPITELASDDILSKKLRAHMKDLGLDDKIISKQIIRK
jgi:hypothetical protein